MAIIICPNCRSAVSSRERRCWICQKSLAPPVTARRGPVSYPQRMRLVRFEETAGGLSDGFRCRIVYLKSVEDDEPVRGYWQAMRDQQIRRARQACAGLAAALSVLLFALLWVTAPPPPPAQPLTVMTPQRIAPARVPNHLLPAIAPMIRPANAAIPFQPIVFPHQDMHGIDEASPSGPSAG